MIAAEGRRIGPYRTTGILGRGGVGIVYSATRDGGSYSREVAIKLIQLGMDSPETRAWFSREQQALSRLSHPAIALLLDAGVTDGDTPYLVIEKVDGLPLSEYCQSHVLSVRQRLELFLNVCDAVEHAHQNLVIHSDLKPANILVGKDGKPKLLDFGISQWALGEAEENERRAAVLTPSYASPEQIRGERLNTSTDIYSLGVLLYEVLTGVTPYQLEGLAFTEMERIVTAGVPKAHAKLQGDLALITGMAMHPEAARRYASVALLAGDVRRYLEEKPITARADSIQYRLGRFLTRHFWGATAAAMIVVTLSAGTYYTWRQARNAERRFQQVRLMANSFLFDFDSRIQALPGSLDARELVARKALEYLSALRAESAGDAELEWDIANAYEKIGDAQGYPNIANLGRTGDAILSYRESLRLKERLAELEPTPSKLRSLANTRFRLGDLLLHAGDSQAAKDFYAQGLSSAALTSNGSHEDLLLQGGGQMRLGQIMAATGDASGAYGAFRRACEAYRKLSDVSPTPELLDLTMVSSFRAAYSLVWSGRLDEAQLSFQEAMKAGEAAVGPHSTDMTHMRDLAVTYWSFGDLMGSPFHINLGKPAEAEMYYRKAGEITSRMMTLSPKNAQSQIADNNVRIRLAHLARATHPAQALQIYQGLLKSNDRLLASDSKNLEYQRDRGFILFGIGSLRAETGALDEGLLSLRFALQIQEDNATGDPARTQFRQDMIPTRLALGDVLNKLQMKEEANREVDAACALAEAQRGISPHNLYSIRNLSDCYLAKARLGDREGWIAKDLELWRNWESAHGANVYVERRKRGGGQ